MVDAKRLKPKRIRGAVLLVEMHLAQAPSSRFTAVNEKDQPKIAISVNGACCTEAHRRLLPDETTSGNTNSSKRKALVLIKVIRVLNGMYTATHATTNDLIWLSKPMVESGIGSCSISPAAMMHASQTLTAALTSTR